MAIGATNARCSDRDEYDIDVMAELDIPGETDPETALSLLERSIRGEKGSRYHGKTKRRTRCVTIEYADGMHLDVTPARSEEHTSELQSLMRISYAVFCLKKKKYKNTTRAIATKRHITA